MTDRDSTDQSGDERAVARDQSGDDRPGVDGGPARGDHGRVRSDGGFPGLRGPNSRPFVTDAVEATVVSGATVVLAAAATVLAIGVALDVAWPAIVGLVAGGTLAVASWLCNRRGPVATASGSVVVAVGVLAAAYALTRPLEGVPTPEVVGGVVFAFAALVTGLGAGATIPGALGSGQWLRTVWRAGTATVLPLVVVGVAVAENVEETGAILEWVASTVGEGIDVVVFPVGPNANVGGFVALCALAAFGLAVALGVLPVVSLVAKAKRGAVAERIALTRTWLWRAVIVGVPLAILLTAFPREPLHGTFVDLGVEGVLQAIVDEHVLRAALAGVAVVAFGAAGVTTTVRRVARLDGRRVLRVVTMTMPGGVALLAVAFLDPGVVLSEVRVGPGDQLVDAGISFLGAPALALVALVALVYATTTILSVVTTAAAIGFIPDRTAAPSVAAGGVLLAAIAAGIGPSVDAVVVFGAVAVSMVVWDVGNYGVDVTAELAGTTSRAVEVLHAAGSVTIGVVVVGIDLASLWVSRTLAAGGGIDGPAVLGLVVFVLGTVVLMSTLRG